VFKVRQHVQAVARARGRDEAVSGEAEHDPVVEDHAVLAQVHHVLAAADLDRARPGQVQRVKEGGGIGPGDLDLAERRAVSDAAALADPFRFGEAGCEGIGAVRAVIAWPHPKPHRLEHGAVGRMPVVQRRAPRGPERGADA